MRYNIHFKDNNYLSPTTYTQELAEYTVNLSYEDIPPEVVERAKMILLQVVGAALAAKETPIAKKICKMSLEANNGNGGPTTVWGMGKKMSAVNASFVLSSMADILEWEDCSWTGHPSAGIIPSAWLAAEERKRSGKELIASIVAAYEVYQRIAMAVQPTDELLRERGWAALNWQLFGTVIAASKLYGLDARKINQAISIACDTSTFPSPMNFSDFYHYEYGFVARDGFLVVQAVERGINNNLDCLDDPSCYTAVLCGSIGGTAGEAKIISNEADPSWFTRELGTRYLIMETMLKRWPANVWIQGAAEILSGLVKKHGFSPEDVEEILVDPPVKGRTDIPAAGFETITQAEYSAPYVLAVMLCHPEPGADWYTPEMMADPKVMALAKRIKRGASPEITAMDCFKVFRQGSFPESTVIVKLKDGTTFSGTESQIPGHPSNMMSCEESVNQFRVMTKSVLDDEKREKLIKILCNIEKIEDISSVSDLLM